MTKNQVKKHVTLPEITETLMSRCSSQLSSDGEPTLQQETTEKGQTKEHGEKVEYLKLPVIMWPKEEVNIFHNVDNCLSKVEPTADPKAPETFKDELQALKEDLKQLGTYQSPPASGQERTSSERYQDELKGLKENMKQIVIESRDIILEVRIRDEEARKQANEEKKAARKAAKFAEKTTETSNTTLSKSMKSLKKSVNSKRVKENEESSEVSQTDEIIEERDSDLESISSSYSRQSDGSLSSTEKIAKKTHKNNRLNSKRRNDLKDKGVNEAPRPKNKRNGVVNLRPISEERGSSLSNKPKTPQNSNELKTNELNEGNKTLNNTVNEEDEQQNDNENRHEEQMKTEDTLHDEKMHSNEMPNDSNIDNEDHSKNNFQTTNNEVKGITTEEVDFFHSQRVRRQFNFDLFDSRLNDIESVSSKVTSRRSSSVGLPGNRVKDKKFYLDRYRVPKQPMEIALQLHKLGFEFESNRVRDLYAAIQECNNNLKNAIAQEKRDIIEERKRIEKEARERERQEAQRRRMEENEAKEAKRREQEAIQREHRRKAAIERRKYNLEMRRNVNNTILESKASRSYRFSYFRYLPPPKRASLAPSPDSSECDSDETEEDTIDKAPKEPVQYKPVKRSACHSARTKTTIK